MVQIGRLLRVMDNSAVHGFPIVIRENKNREMYIFNKFGKFSTREYFHLYSIA